MRYHVRNFPQAYFTNRSLCLRRSCVSSAGLILTSLAVFSTSASAASVERIARTEPATSERAKKKKPLSPIETIRVARDAHRTPRANGSILTRSDWRNVLSGSNPLALLSQVSGVSYTASDAYGLDESDASLFLRGFHMNELGILFENIPLNETSFGTLNGTNVLNISVPDTIGSIYVSPGTARENLFSNSNNGGEIRYMLLAPTQKRSLSINQGVGSNNTLVTTLVGQSGQLGANGPKVMAGFQRISKDKYQGSGSQYMTRGNVKATQETGWGAFNAFFSASSARIAGYNDVSHDMLNRLGWRGSDYTYPDYETAYKAALPENADKPCGGGYSCAERAALTPYDSGQVTRDLIGSLTHEFRLTPHLKGKAVFYGATTYTDASVSDPTTPSETGAPFSEQVWHSAVRRFGGSFELGYRLARHDLSAGIWQEAAHSDAHQAWYNEPLLGQSAPLKAVGPFDTYGDAFQTANLSTWNTQSRQIFLHDDWKITDALTLGAGFKAVDFVSSGGGIGDDQAPRGRLRSQAGFLPHLSALWRYNKHDDVFIDAAQTQSAYRLSPRGNIGYSASIWSASDQASFDEALARIAPERDTTVTIGGHLKRKWISLSWDGYFSLIENRLVSASVGTLHSPVNTVGTVRASHIWGGDVAASLPIGSHFTLRQSLSVSRFRYGGDLFVGGETFDLRGKAQPGYPELSLQTSALVHVSHLEMGATNIVYLNRPFSYTNDIMGPNYWNMTAYASWKFERRGKIPPFTARLDVYNLMNSKMIGNLNVDGAPFSGDLQTMQRSSPRQMVFSLGTQF